MKKNTILAIVIPVIIVLLVVGAVAYLKLSSSPKVVFKTAINKVFDKLESKEEEHTTVSGTMNLSGKVKTEDEQTKEMAEFLKETKLAVKMNYDAKNAVLNDEVNITYKDESLLNATVLLQDGKGYLYLKNLFSKYLELPMEDMDYSEFTEYGQKVLTLDNDKLMETVKEELIKEVSKQEFSKEKTTINLDGKETKVEESILSLTEEQFTVFCKELLENLKQNTKFLEALGECKNGAVDSIDNMLEQITAEREYNEANKVNISIYTKGLFKKELVGASAKMVDAEETIALDVIRHNKNKYEISAYTVYEDEKETNFNILIENNKESKNKGTAKITVDTANKQVIFLCDYEENDDEVKYKLSTEIKGTRFVISGTTLADKKNISGNMEFSMPQEGNRDIILKLDYDFEYDVEVEKTDVGNSVLVDELTNEDYNEIYENLQDSKLFQFLKSVYTKISTTQY